MKKRFNAIPLPGLALLGSMTIGCMVPADGSEIGQSAEAFAGEPVPAADPALGSASQALTVTRAVAIHPVIYAGNAGGPGEYRASINPDQPEVHIVDMPLASGESIIPGAVFYSPYHNVPDINQFAYVEVSPHGTSQIEIKVASWPGRNGRVRIKIQALVTR